MDFIKYQCPSCEKTLKIPNNLIGKTLKCPNCKNLINPTFEENLVEEPLEPTTEPAPVRKRKLANVVFCQSCGAENSDQNISCENCNEPLTSNNQMSNSKQYENVPNYLVTSIIVTLCCCLPFGIVAIVYAASVNAKVAAGDIQGAKSASGTALMWCYLGAIPSIILSVIYFVLLIVVEANKR